MEKFHQAWCNCSKNLRRGESQSAIPASTIGDESRVKIAASMSLQKMPGTSIE
jgi:hypothetical protein